MMRVTPPNGFPFSYGNPISSWSSVPSPPTTPNGAYARMSVNLVQQETVTPSGATDSTQAADHTVFEEKSARARQIRFNAESWASREGLSAEELREFRELMRMVTSQYIPREKLLNPVYIDKGSYGQISRSEYDSISVAVKEFGTEGESGISRRLSEIYHELRMLVQVRHPNVVGFWGATVDFADSRGVASLSLVFELCENGSLYKHIHADNSQSRLQPTQKVNIAAQVATGLAYLHSKSIVHLDLTPNNILLTSSFAAKIGDFGFARFLSEHTGAVRTVDVEGSPAYMPPEQLVAGILTPAVDVWALATIMWEMMAEEIPWRQYGSFEQLRDALCAGHRLQLPAASSGALPAGYVAVMQAAMKTQPHDRPTAANMSRELRAAATAAAAGFASIPLSFSVPSSPMTSIFAHATSQIPMQPTAYSPSMGRTSPVPMPYTARAVTSPVPMPYTLPVSSMPPMSPHGANMYTGPFVRY